MSELDREVAGIRCRDVLTELSDYFDGDLSNERVGQINEHLSGCDRCERFGGEFSSVVSALKGLLSTPPDEEQSRERLLRGLAVELGEA